MSNFAIIEIRKILLKIKKWAPPSTPIDRDNPKPKKSISSLFLLYCLFRSIANIFSLCIPDNYILNNQIKQYTINQKFLEDTFMK